jgi:DNA-binding transcriptional MerR regulator
MRCDLHINAPFIIREAGAASLGYAIVAVLSQRALNRLELPLITVMGAVFNGVGGLVSIPYLLTGSVLLLPWIIAPVGLIVLVVCVVALRQNSPARGDGRVCIEAIAKQMCYPYRVNRMIRIGDFSRLSRVSIKTLRYYDEVELFKLIEVDRFTGYRCYSASQLPRLNRILALRDLGLSLEQIAQVLNEGISPEHLRGMLRLKRAELQQHIASEQERLARVEARLNIIEMEDRMPEYDVVIKQVEPQLLLESVILFLAIQRLVAFCEKCIIT